MPGTIQTLGFLVRPYEVLERCYRTYGDMFTIRLLGDKTYVVVSDPQLVRHVFAGCGAPESLDVGNSEFKPLLGENSILILNGPRHRRHRALLLPPFRPAGFSSYGAHAWSIAEETGLGWTRGDTFAVMPLMRRISIAVIVAIVFGKRAPEQTQKFRSAVERLMQFVNGPLVYVAMLQKDLGRWSPGGRVWHARRQLLELIDTEIADCRRGTIKDAGNALLNVLVQARDDAGDPLTDTEIREEILTMLLAGHDPTTAASSWMLYCIHEEAAVDEKVREELRSCPPAPEAIAALPYLDAVCNESLRLYPVIPVVERVARVPLQIGRFDIPPDCRIAPCIYLVHRRPDLFPEPESFRPERFLGRRYAPHEFFPFGGGSRRCVGASFAPYQMKLVVASLLRRFRFRRTAGKIRPRFRGAAVTPSSNFALQVTDVGIN